MYNNQRNTNPYSGYNGYQSMQQSTVIPSQYSIYQQNATIPQYQAPQQSLLQQTQRGHNGRILESLEDTINPSEVPMSGVSLFPTKDYGCIIAKCWNANGGIDTMMFVPKDANAPNQQIMQVLQNIDARLQNLENNSNNFKKQNSNMRKEVKQDGVQQQ